MVHESCKCKTKKVEYQTRCMIFFNAKIPKPKQPQKLQMEATRCISQFQIQSRLLTPVMKGMGVVRTGIPQILRMPICKQRTPESVHTHPVILDILKEPRAGRNWPRGSWQPKGSSHWQCFSSRLKRRKSGRMKTWATLGERCCAA